MESHLHLCAVLGAVSQELKDQNLPCSPVAYFGATCSSLDRISLESNSPSHVIGALLTVISLLIHDLRYIIFSVNSKFEFSVRRQSHLSLRDILLNFQNSSLLASASEEVKKFLESHLLLDDGADANASEGIVRAQQILYILDALKESLPFLSLKCKTRILECYKILLNLH
ncbi:hypothetical protein PIB30_087539 [Stylosanthes scabra]|uniref:RRP12 N-terminal HEAT domain-containing protein n=1 Tax=Stylosanthes scabra TaxID=79078 RepID=A0ABU6STP2_9FABA|nr:hypothetical protein [Stylosanthes scabra]